MRIVPVLLTVSVLLSGGRAGFLGTAHLNSGVLRNPPRRHWRGSTQTQAQRGVFSTPMQRRPIAGMGGPHMPRTTQKNSGRTSVITHADRDFYAILGVSRNADAKEVKSAYRQKARKMHPDINKAPDATEKFQEITAAYEVLSDPEKKRMYDQFGEAAFQGGGAGPGGMGGVDLNDIFGSFFGGMGGMGGGFGGMGGAGRAQGPTRGDDLQMNLDLDFKDAVFGANQEFELTRKITCTTCSGNRMKPGTSMKTCSECSGTGVTVQRVRSPFGVLQTQAACSKCGGQGKTIEQYCLNCNGQGRVTERKPLSVKIPCGVSDGARLRVAASGDAGDNGGPPGDLYLILRTKGDPRFVRKDKQIYTTKEVPYTDAILGCYVQVEIVDGSELQMQIPAGTQPGTQLKMRGKGVPELNKPDRRGDHIVTVKVTIPKKLSDEQRAKVEELRSLGVGLSAFEAPSIPVLYFVSAVCVLVFLSLALVSLKKQCSLQKTVGRLKGSFVHA